MTTDVCVPISELPGALVHARDAIASRGFEGAILGHVGDGNYHAVFPVDTRRGGPPEGQSGQRRDRRLRPRARRHLHGRARRRLGQDGGPEGGARRLLPFMRAIKRLADPNGVLNPGKIFPD